MRRRSSGAPVSINCAVETGIDTLGGEDTLAAGSARSSKRIARATRKLNPASCHIVRCAPGRPLHAIAPGKPPLPAPLANRAGPNPKDWRQKSRKLKRSWWCRCMLWKAMEKWFCGIRRLLVEEHARDVRLNVLRNQIDVDATKERCRNGGGNDCLPYCHLEKSFSGKG